MDMYSKHPHYRIYIFTTAKSNFGCSGTIITYQYVIHHYDTMYHILRITNSTAFTSRHRLSASIRKNAVRPLSCIKAPVFIWGQTSIRWSMVFRNYHFICQYLGKIKWVPAELLCLSKRHDLDVERPRWKVSGSDGLVQVPCCMVRVGASEMFRLGTSQILYTLVCLGQLTAQTNQLNLQQASDVYCRSQHSQCHWHQQWYYVMVRVVP